MNIIEGKCHPSTGWASYREDEARTWIEFTHLNGNVVRWDKRGPSGACIGEGRFV